MDGTQAELRLENKIATIRKKLFNHMYKIEEKVKLNWSEVGVEINGNSGTVSKLCLVFNRNNKIE